MGLILLKIKYHLGALFVLLKYKILFGSRFSVGKGTTCRKQFNVYIENGAKINIGKGCFFNNGCSLNSLEEIVIGDGCLFGENVKIYDHNHRFSNPDIPIKEQGYTKGKVTIGRHCWICSNVTILRGVTIGDNCVIGAGVVLNMPVPNNSIVNNHTYMQIERIKKGGNSNGSN